MKKAVVLLSGGLDSTTCAYLAREAGYEIYALSFDYGQRLRREVHSAEAVARAVGAKAHQVVKFDLRQWGGSSLTSDDTVPQGRAEAEMADGIPSTYVPGRNLIFLSFGVSYAEAIGAEALYIGVNALDYSGYPDCRPAFVAAMQQVIRLGTRAGTQGQAIRIEAPLLYLTKAGIVQAGMRAGADYSVTWSCYLGGEKPCGTCDSCQLRAKGFQEAGYADPALPIK